MRVVEISIHDTTARTHIAIPNTRRLFAQLLKPLLICSSCVLLSTFSITPYFFFVRTVHTTCVLWLYLAPIAARRLPRLPWRPGVHTKRRARRAARRPPPAPRELDWRLRE